METSPSLASLAAQLARGASELASDLNSPPVAPDYLDLIHRSHVTQELAQEVLGRCVQQSRDAGKTWQEIGDLLGVTRQAAFQRFGKPIDPRTGKLMDKSVRMTDASVKARSIVTDVLEGQMDRARESFSPELLVAFTDQARGDALATVAGLVGEFEGFGSAEPLTRQIGDHTVVDLAMRYEAGDMKARVAFDANHKVAGLFILTPETA